MFPKVCILIEFREIDRIISQCVYQVDHLQMYLNAHTEFDNIFEEKYDQGLDYEPPEDPECKLTIRNIYDVSVDREEEDFLIVVERILTRVYEEDFDKLRASVQVGGEEARSVSLIRRLYEVPEW